MGYKSRVLLNGLFFGTARKKIHQLITTFRELAWLYESLFYICITRLKISFYISAYVRFMIINIFTTMLMLYIRPVFIL